jgi:hypothetical protein
MALGEKVFEEIGKVTNTKVVSVHPVEGVKMEVSFSAELKGVGSFPSGSNMGSGMMVQYPHGSVNAQYQGVVTTAAEGEQFMWWASQKGRVVEGGKVKSIVIVSGVTSSQKLSWMNSSVIVIDSELDPVAQQFRNTGYLWK